MQILIIILKKSNIQFKKKIREDINYDLNRN